MNILFISILLLRYKAHT